MEEFYFLRHGQTDANLQGLMCGGKWDLPLNENGLNQANDAAIKFRELGIGFKTVCVSPLRRARETVAQILPYLNSVPKLVQVEELREWDIGNWDRLPFESVKEQFLGNGEPEGGESRAEFKHRVLLGLEKSLSQNSPILVVAHGAVWLAIQDLLKIPAIRIENCIPHRIHGLSDGTFAAQKL